jgi:hypothetical protein
VLNSERSRLQGRGLLGPLHVETGRFSLTYARQNGGRLAVAKGRQTRGSGCPELKMPAALKPEGERDRQDCSPGLEGISPL